MTNTDFLEEKLKEKGIFLSNKSDTQAILHTISYNLDEEFRKNNLMGIDLIKVLTSFIGTIRPSNPTTGGTFLGRLARKSMKLSIFIPVLLLHSLSTLS